jgi:hypothetical protein
MLYMIQRYFKINPSRWLMDIPHFHDQRKDASIFIATKQYNKSLSYQSLLQSISNNDSL